MASAASLLLFSGGPTQAAAGERTEAESYLESVASRGWWGNPEVAERAFTGNYARDSFENLLFSIMRFQELNGAWPDLVTVCGWRFKAERLDLHRRAIQRPLNQYEYIGVNNPPAGTLNLALHDEAVLVKSVRRDPLLAGPEFIRKRAARNPLGRRRPYRLLQAAASGRIPWNR